MNENFIVPITRQTPTSVNKKETTYPTEMIDLPSEGHFYPENHILSVGQVEMKMMTAREEDILMNQNLIKKCIVLDKLLESLIVDKNIKLDDVLLCDKNALYVASRRLAYGDNYGPLDVKCVKCSENNSVNINLGELKPKELDTSKYTPHQNRFEYTLPYCKKVVTYKLLTHQDDKAIDSELKSSAKLYKNGGSNELTTRLKFVITSVNGNEDKAEIRNFIENELTSRDSLSLRTNIKENTPEFDMNFNFVCEHCNAEERMGVPLTVSFFWPST